MKKYFDWNRSKSLLLKKERGISFEDIKAAIDEGYLLQTNNHPNQVKYPNQKVFLVNVSNYIYIVLFVEDDQKIFLKTIFPSRKATKKYILNKS